MRRKQTKVRGKRRSHEAGKFQVHYAIMKTKLRHFFTMLVLLVLALGSDDIRSATLTWNGSISTDWNNPTNWTPQQVPTVSDHVVINSGSVTIPAEGVFAIMDWTGGEVDGALTVASNGVLNVNLGDRSVWTASLTNWGTIHWSDSQTWWLYGCAIYNQPGALIDMQGNGYLDYELNSEVVVNNGTFRKSAGSGNTVINVPFVNNAAVEVQSGALGFSRGGSVGGTYSMTAGNIQLTGGSFVENGLPVFTGTGQAQMTGGSLTLNTDVIPGLTLAGGSLFLDAGFQGGSITNLTLSGIALKGTNTVTGILWWTGGEVDGALTVASNGVLNVNLGDRSVWTASLTNWGTIHWSDSQTWWLYGGAIYNQPGALIDMQGNGYLDYELNSEVVVNNGTFRKSAGSGNTVINVPFVNNAAVEVQSGALGFSRGGSVGGTYSMTAGNIQLTGGSFVENGLPVFTGTGQAQMTGGSLTLNTDVIPGLTLAGGSLFLDAGFQGGSITNLTLSGIALKGTNTVTGILWWTGGEVDGALTVASNGVLNVNLGDRSVWTASLTNWGTIHWSDSQTWWLYGGAIYNQPGALIDMQGNGYLDYELNSEVVVNNGTFRKSAGSGNTVINVP